MVREPRMDAVGRKATKALDAENAKLQKLAGRVDAREMRSRAKRFEKW